MLEPAVIVLRLVQFAGAMILFGSSLFLIYALPRAGPGSGAQLTWSRPFFWLCTGLGAVVSASLAWMGHGAATEGTGGPIHLTADVLHALAAGVWIGALVVFFGLLSPTMWDAGNHHAVHRALHGFAGVGSGLVAVLVGTGLVNSWFLVGPARITGLWTTPYGQLLLLKLVLFAGMLGLAATNRFRLTPALGAALENHETRHAALAALRQSLVIETALAFLVLGVIAWLGMLAPVSAQ